MEPAIVRPNCRLFVVSCTFKRPTELRFGSGGGLSKLCGSVRTLLYADRETYVKGLDDILENPVLTMEREFNRPTCKPFVDWRGVTHTLPNLWAYATGPAKTSGKESEGAGIRDKENDGMTPQMFMERVNTYIAKQRQLFIEGYNRGDASNGGDDPRLLLVNEEDASLTLNEVLAVRLYSGPAFQPINEFLREIGKLSGEFRLQMARHRELTFAATTRHLCSAIRKLADVTRGGEATAPAAASPGGASGWQRVRDNLTAAIGGRSITLYRGVRGELPPAFWDRDEAGMISAVDSGFMSTSKNRNTPIQYMQGELNVLWTLAATEPSDDAYHRGADISMLSQYAHEDEVLYPPCTMMIVQGAEQQQQSPSRAQVAAMTDEERLAAAMRASFSTVVDTVVNADRQGHREANQGLLSVDEGDKKSGKAWKRIHVRPCFV